MNITLRGGAVILGLLLACVGLAACGSSSSTTTSTTTTPATTSAATTPATTTTTSTAPSYRAQSPRFAAVRECLAKKGITYPHRTPGTPGGPQLPKGMTSTQLDEALNSCGKLAHFGAPSTIHRSRLDSPRYHGALMQFAKCLRQNGVHVGEPNTSGKGPILSTKGLNTGSPQFRAASTKCRAALFSSLHLNNKARRGTATSG